MHNIPLKVNFTLSYHKKVMGTITEKTAKAFLILSKETFQYLLTFIISVI